MTLQMDGRDAEISLYLTFNVFCATILWHPNPTKNVYCILTEKKKTGLKWKIDISKGKSWTFISGQDESGSIYIFHHPPLGYWRTQRQTGVFLKLIRQRADLSQIKSTDSKKRTFWNQPDPGILLLLLKETTFDDEIVWASIEWFFSLFWWITIHKSKISVVSSNKRRSGKSQTSSLRYCKVALHVYSFLWHISVFKWHLFPVHFNDKEITYSLSVIQYYSLSLLHINKKWWITFLI